MERGRKRKHKKLYDRRDELLASMKRDAQDKAKK